MQKVVVDIRMYLLYLLLVMWGFACAYSVRARERLASALGSVQCQQQCCGSCACSAAGRLWLG